MNIFVTHKNPKDAVQFLGDRHLSKAIVETVQLLSTAMRKAGYIGNDVYKSTHEQHPCTIWTGECRENYVWLLAYFVHATKEYYYRKGKEHKTESLFLTLYEGQFLMPELRADDNYPKRTPFVNCTPYKALPVHEAYRLTLYDKWLKNWRDGYHPSYYTASLPIYENEDRSEYANRKLWK